MINIELLHSIFITDDRGNKQFVILPIAAFQEWLDDLDDLEDLAMIDEKKVETTTTHSDLVKELKNDGLL